MLLAETACAFFVSWYVLRLLCFFGDGNDVGTGDRYRLNETFSVFPSFVFSLRSEGSLSSYCTFGSKVLLFSASVYWLIKANALSLLAWLLFSFDLLLLVILSFPDKVGLSKDDPLWKVALMKFRFKYVLLGIRRKRQHQQIRSSGLFVLDIPCYYFQ